MKLLLVDGYSLLYRAFFSSPPLTTRDGKPTGALYSFTKMVLRLLDDAKPEYALVALDAHGPTFRHQADTSYKANRSAAPDDLSTQTRLVRELLDGLSIPKYEHEGFEADDILGTLSVLGTKEGVEVIIVTGDGDALQLVNDKVSVMLTRRGVSDLEAYGPDEFRARFGFEPLLLPDYKGLRGDTSDNIPGVPGIGDKTAMSLVGKFGALENIYENIEDVTPPRIRELLREHKEAAFHSRELARIVRDLPLDMDFHACRLPAMDEKARNRAIVTVREFEFKSLIARYQPTLSSAETESEPDSDALASSPVVEPQHAATAAQFQEWVQAQHTHDEKAPIAFLMEFEKDGQPRTDAVAFSGGDQPLIFTGALEELRSFLEDTAQPKIVHDAKTLKLTLARQGLALRGVVADTLLMAYLLDPTRQQHPLPVLALKYLKYTLPKLEPEPVIKPAKPAKKSAKAAATAATDAPANSLFEANDDAPRDETSKEAPAEEAKDPNALTPRQMVLAATAHALGGLYPTFCAELQKIGEFDLFGDIELPLVDVLVQMEQAGMLLDPEQLRSLGATLETTANRLQDEIWKLAGEEFNIGSTKQLQVILFEKLGLAKGRATKTGYSTDVHTLAKLAEQHDVVRKILEYRGTTKLKTTYVDALLNGMDPRSHRIHTNLNQTGAVSGRLSSSDPNLQNVPIRTEQGRMIRRAFVAPPGCVLMKADYSQIELRILAHVTGDEPLVSAFNSGQDVHARTAADLFGVPVEAVDAEMRRKAKMTNYAIAYGVSGFGLARQLGTGSAGEAQEFITRYFAALPGVKKYIDDTLRSARLDGYVSTLLGRRRPLPDIHAPRPPDRASAERTAINHPIQGTSADMMKLAMLAIDDAMRDQKLRSRMVMQVHDELVFEVPTEEIEEMTELVHRLMVEAPLAKIPLRVPLEADVGTGPNWNDTHDEVPGGEGDVEVEDLVGVELE